MKMMVELFKKNYQIPKRETKKTHRKCIERFAKSTISLNVLHTRKNELCNYECSQRKGPVSIPNISTCISASIQALILFAIFALLKCLCYDILSQKKNKHTQLLVSVVSVWDPKPYELRHYSWL